MFQPSARVFWFFGYSGAGKTTVANELYKQMQEAGCPAYVLDGDILRIGLCKDLGFSISDRTENIRRAAECAVLLANAGVNVIAAFITPTEQDRKLASSIVGDERFISVYIDTPFEICEQRDPKGIYAKARSGKIKSFTGIDSPFEVPEQVTVRINTESVLPHEAAKTVFDLIKQHNKILEK